MKFSLIPRHPRSRRWLPAAVLAPLIAFAAGCASPGPPQPPSLNLPAVVKDLAAERAGDVVHLHWTTPETTTDRLDIKGAMTAEICRLTVAPATPQPACTPISRLPVQSGLTHATEPLPPNLTIDPPALVAYRVNIFNVHGRSAGLSPEAFVVAGRRRSSAGRTTPCDANPRRRHARVAADKHLGVSRVRPASRGPRWSCRRAATTQNGNKILLQTHDQKAACKPPKTKAGPCRPAKAASNGRDRPH